MGEARRRGTNGERIEAAEKRKQAIDEAIESREHARGVVWLVIESTNSVPATDDGGAFILGENGGMVYGPDESAWIPLREVDQPVWIKQDDIMGELKAGIRVCQDAEDGGRWYRGLVMVPPDVVKH